MPDKRPRWGMKHDRRAIEEGWQITFDGSRHTIRCVYWVRGQRFFTDQDAELYVAMRAAAGSMLHQRALRVVAVTVTSNP